MWPGGSNPPISARRGGPALLGAVLLGAAALGWWAGAAGRRCSPPDAGGPVREPVVRPAGGAYTVCTYNLQHYGLQDRDGDGQWNDPKPVREREAVADLLARLKPDILAVQEIGNPEIFGEFTGRLARNGLEYPHRALLQRGAGEDNLAVLSRFPIVARTDRLDDRYRIGAEDLTVLRGFLDVTLQVTPSYRVRLLVAHLKSKRFHRLGQTEMRRNEARLLANHVRQALRENPRANLLVCGDLNDDPGSAPLRELTGERGEILDDLRPVDAVGDAWTHRSWSLDAHARLDYFLASPGLKADWVRDGTRAVRDPAADRASDHRPLVAVFRAADETP